MLTASVLVRLADLGPPSELRRHAPTVAAETLGHDRVLLSSLHHGRLVPEALNPGRPDAAELIERLARADLALAYPVIEAEIVRRRRPQLVDADVEGASVRHAVATALDWRQYVAAPVLSDGRVIGFLHATRAGLTDDDATSLSAFATCFGVVYERAVLRQRLRSQGEQLREIASWADARTSELRDSSVALSEDGADPVAAGAQTNGSAGEEALRDLLTRREVDVMRLIVRGITNADIARELVVSEGTVKFHVKNILRKMRAANRAEATSQYLRLTLNRPG